MGAWHIWVNKRHILLNISVVVGNYHARERETAMADGTASPGPDPYLFFFFFFSSDYCLCR